MNGNNLAITKQKRYRAAAQNRGNENGDLAYYR